MNQLLVARHDGVDGRILPCPLTLETKLARVIGERWGNVDSRAPVSTGDGEEHRRKPTEHEPSLPQMADGAETTQAGEEVVGGGDVAGDLRAEFCGAAEFFFFAETFPEEDFDALGRGLSRKIQKMRLDAECGTVEGGTHADVGDGAAAARLAFEKSSRDVNAAGGQKFLLGSEIECGKSEARARSRPAYDFSSEHEGPPQQARGVGYVTHCDFAPDDGAGDNLAAVQYGRDDDHFKVVLLAEFAQELHIAGLFVAEAEIFAYQHGAHAQIAQ